MTSRIPGVLTALLLAPVLASAADEPTVHIMKRPLRAAFRFSGHCAGFSSRRTPTESAARFQISSSWRDSRAGYGGGRFAMDVNAIWVPRALEGIGDYSLVCLTSPNGATLLAEGLMRRGRDARSLAGTVVAAIGPGTAAQLARFGIGADPSLRATRSRSMRIRCARRSGCRWPARSVGSGFFGTRSVLPVHETQHGVELARGRGAQVGRLHQPAQPADRRPV